MRAARIQLHIAVLLFGVAGLFGKLVPLDAVVIVFGRTVFAAIAILTGLRIFRMSLALESGKSFLLLLVSGVVLATHWVTFFHAIQISTVAIGLIGFATFPVFVVFIEPLISGQKIRAVDLASTALVVVGLLLVAPAFSLADQGLIGLLWAIVSGATFAVLTLLNRHLVQRQPSMVVVFYQHSTAALCLLPFVVHQPISLEQNSFWLLLVLGVLCTALPQTLFIQSLAVLKAQFVSVVTALEPVYGILLAMLILNEIPDLSTMLGAAIVIGAVVLAMTAHSNTASTSKQKAGADQQN